MSERWIKCSDRLPELIDYDGRESVFVLVLAPGSSPGIRVAMLREMEGALDWWIVADGHLALESVTYWRPLPAVPAESELQPVTVGVTR